MVKVGRGRWRAGALVTAGALVWACSGTDPDDSRDATGDGGTDSGGEGGNAPSLAGKAGGMPAGGSSGGGGEPGFEAGAGSDAGASGSGTVGNSCEESLPVAPLEEAGGAGGTAGDSGAGGSGGDASCVQSLALLCDELVSAPYYERCPGYAGADHLFEDGCTRHDTDGELECAITFPNSCGGHSVRLLQPDQLVVWHFDASGILVGAIKQPQGNASAMECAARFYGQACDKIGTAIDMCELEGGACPRELSENTWQGYGGRVDTYADLPSYMFGGDFRNDCGGFTAIRSGEHQALTSYTFDLEGNLLGVLYRGYSTRCADGSLRFGDQFGQYCPPNTEQPYSFDCAASGVGGCSN